MNRLRTTLAIVCAISILLFDHLIPGSNWSQFQHLWLVPIRLGLEAAAPFLVSSVVATLIAGRRLILPLLGIWAMYWLSLIVFFGAFGPMANPPAYLDLVRWNILGMTFSFVAVYLGIHIAGLVLRRWRRECHTAT